MQATKHMSAKYKPFAVMNLTFLGKLRLTDPQGFHCSGNQTMGRPSKFKKLLLCCVCNFLVATIAVHALRDRELVPRKFIPNALGQIVNLDVTLWREGSSRGSRPDLRNSAWHVDSAQHHLKIRFTHAKDLMSSRFSSRLNVKAIVENLRFNHRHNINFKTQFQTKP